MCGAVNKESWIRKAADQDKEKMFTPEDAGQQRDHKGGDTIYAGAYSHEGEFPEACNGSTARNGTGDAFDNAAKHNSRVPIGRDHSVEGQAKVIKEIPEPMLNVDPENIAKHESTMRFSSGPGMEGSGRVQAQAVKEEVLFAKRMSGVGLGNVATRESTPEILSHPGFEGCVQRPEKAVKEAGEPMRDAAMLEGRGDGARRRFR